MLRQRLRKDGYTQHQHKEKENSQVILHDLKPDLTQIPATLFNYAAVRFWLAVVCVGVAAGIGGLALNRLLELTQRLAWGGSGIGILEAASRSSAWRHVTVLVSAGIAVGLGKFLLSKFTSGNGASDVTSAIWFSAGRLPKLRVAGSALLSIIIVGMGASLGREGAPKQLGAVSANLVSDKACLSDDQRRVLVACGAGAGMAAAYGVPLGGALFALEVLSGMLSVRLILPAIVASLLATTVSWIGLPNAATYLVPSYSNSFGNVLSAFIIGSVIGFVATGYTRGIAWAERNKPRGLKRITAPILVLGILGLVSIKFPQLLGNGMDLSQLLFRTGVGSLGLLAALMVLKPAAAVFCVASGTPGGLFTPSLTAGALAGCALGHIGVNLWPGLSPGFCALLGAGAMLAATTQGPISSAVLIMELTGRDRSFIAPLLASIACATLVSRSIEPRSIYEVRLSEEELEERIAAHNRFL